MVTDFKAPQMVANVTAPHTVAKAEIPRTEVTALKVATEAAAAEQQATAEDQWPQSGRPTTRSWEAADVRPVQAERAARKHRRKGAGAEVEEARAASPCSIRGGPVQRPAPSLYALSCARARALDGCVCAHYHVKAAHFRFKMTSLPA